MLLFTYEMSCCCLFSTELDRRLVRDKQELELGQRRLAQMERMRSEKVRNDFVCLP